MRRVAVRTHWAARCTLGSTDLRAGTVDGAEGGQRFAQIVPQHGDELIAPV